MTTANAFWRLFPPALFVVVGSVLSVVWIPDPVLMVLGMCGAGMAVAWLIITTVEVARTLGTASTASAAP